MYITHFFSELKVFNIKFANKIEIINRLSDQREESDY